MNIHKFFILIYIYIFFLIINYMEEVKSEKEKDKKAQVTV